MDQEMWSKLLLSHPVDGEGGNLRDTPAPTVIIVIRLRGGAQQSTVAMSKLSRSRTHR